jgi:hypothetical protein
MQNNAFNNIKKTIEEFQNSLQRQLPALEADVNALIKNKVQDKNTIEYNLDTLLSLTDMGVGQDLFVKLLEHYKTIDAEGAMFYWNEFDKDEQP